MPRRMLINAVRPEELRIAIATGSTLDNYQVEIADVNLTRGNIYRGTIANIAPSLNAAFIDYGAGKHGFLAIQDVVPETYYREPRGGGRPRIDEVLERGKPIVVQVTKEGEGEKGAALTTSLSLAGRYLVLTPFDDQRGVSRKVEDDDMRAELRAIVDKLDVPQGFGVIVRTNALGESKIALARDLAALLRLWKQIESEARRGKGPKLLYSDQDLILRALRDYLDGTVEEILVDDDDAFARAETCLRAFLPRGKMSLIRYNERLPLFARYDLEPQIDRIYERRVDLPSGGSIVIDRTEALTAIDVNSGKSTRAATQEETAFHTNLEAAAEVARQLVLRDLGGLIVVDFIDMRASKHQRKVEKALKDAMKADKARSSVGRISSNGLLEINRQRIAQALSLRTHRACPTCGGTGRIASPEMVGLNLLRRIEARAASGALARVRVSLHPELADAFQNHRRQEIAEIEREFDIRVEVIAASHLHRPDQEIEWTDRPAGERRRPAPPPPPKVMAVQVGDLEAEGESSDDEPAEESAVAGEERGKKRGRRRGGKKRRARGRGGESATATGSDSAGAAEVLPDHERRAPAPSGAEDEGSSDEGEDDGPLPSAGAASGEDEGATPSGAAARRRRRGRRGGKRRRGRGGAGETPGTEEATGTEMSAREPSRSEPEEIAGTGRGEPMGGGHGHEPVPLFEPLRSEE